MGVSAGPEARVTVVLLERRLQWSLEKEELSWERMETKGQELMKLGVLGEVRSDDRSSRWRVGPCCAGEEGVWIFKVALARR